MPPPTLHLPPHPTPPLQALTDLALPRAFEVLHDFSQDPEAEQQQQQQGTQGSKLRASVGGEGEEEEEAVAAERRQRAALRASCAAVVAALVGQCPACCHALLFHSELLRPALATLCASRQFGTARKLLAATAAFARRPTPAALVA